MITLQMFDTREDLCKLTGLSEDALWDKGFDLDDWDVGFCSDNALTYTEFDKNCREWGEWEEPVSGAYWLVRQMENYCVGYDCIKYGGKYYYMVHHS